MNDTMCAYEKRKIFFPILRQNIENYTANGRIESINENTIYYPCDCLPDCELYEYSTELTSAKLNRTYSKTRQML